MRLKFLGTGGSRITTAAQMRRTAGIVIKTDETQIHLDPGPGALVHSRNNLDAPEKTEGVILTHGHLDHYSDVEPIIEMITELNNKPGALFANKSSIKGYSDISRCISKYHQDLCHRTEILEEGAEYNFKDLEIKSQKMFHSDPNTQGLVLDDGDKKIGFWTDSNYSEELLDFYKGSDIMVVNTVTEYSSESNKHTSVREGVKIAEEIDPKKTILTHFGSNLLKNLEENKEWVKENTDQEIIWAEDGMEFPGNRNLSNF